MNGASLFTAAFERELAWVTAMIDTAFRLHFGADCDVAGVAALAPPPWPEPGAGAGAAAGACSGYAAVLHRHRLSAAERLVLMLALIPHVRPQLLDVFLTRNEGLGRAFTEFGGVGSAGQAGFWPTVETAAFILAGKDLGKRLAMHELLHPRAALLRERLVELEPAAGARGLFGCAITVGAERLCMLTCGAGSGPEFSSAFPARQISTALEWDDLVLERHIVHEVEEIRAWIEHRDVLMRDWQLQRHVKPGFRSLFYGPPGTGKTLTAALLGKISRMPVYRIDLSLVVSKFIGETEKNLAGLFDRAERENWILFFDEADALFGKRTATSSANDRYANQEVAYLLQRVEDFPGVVILATNLKGNIDEAFARRFQSMILFPVPKAPERLRLWQNAFPHAERLEPEVDLGKIAADHELAGGAIVNVLQHAALMCLRRGGSRIAVRDIHSGIRRELWKEGKVA